MSYMSTCFKEGLSYRMIICLTGEKILYKDRFYWRVCLIGHELQVDMFCRSTCIMNGHVLLKT